MPVQHEQSARVQGSSCSLPSLAAWSQQVVCCPASINSVAEALVPLRVISVSRTMVRATARKNSLFMTTQSKQRDDALSRPESARDGFILCALVRIEVFFVIFSEVSIIERFFA